MQGLLAIEPERNLEQFVAARYWRLTRANPRHCRLDFHSRGAGHDLRLTSSNGFEHGLIEAADNHPADRAAVANDVEHGLRRFRAIAFDLHDPRHVVMAREQ